MHVRRVERRTAYTPAGVLEGTDIKCNSADRATDQIDPKIDPNNAQKLAGAITSSQCGIGSPTWARTRDLRINSESGASVISLHHPLLTASAQLRHRSRMQCNAGACKTTLAHFWAHPGHRIKPMRAVGVARRRGSRARVSVPYESRLAVLLRASRAIEPLAYSAQRPPGP